MLNAVDNYIDIVNRELKPKKNNSAVVLDLFAGCGGLALGFEAVGFQTIGYEIDDDCCKTYSVNLHGLCHKVDLTPEHKFPLSQIVIGGPPCQPFSVGGNQRGLSDSRDGFPVFISAIAQAKPEIFIFENVRGLLYRNKWYLEEIIHKLEALGYHIDIHLINAVHYLVPQNRERVIVIGHRGGFHFPTHEPVKITAGAALGELAFMVPEDAKFLTSSMDAYVARYELASKCINPRDLHLDKPARTLTCRNLAGATGDMQRIRLPDGSRRRLTVREAARLQSFPDWFEFKGSESSQFKQIGNAVPPMLSYALAKEVAAYLNNDTKNRAKDANIPRPMPIQTSLEFA
jgi:DNA (cytosine-5)-methyltransferase 1